MAAPLKTEGRRITLTVQSVCDLVFSACKKKKKKWGHCSEALKVCLLSFLQDLEVAAEFSLTNGVTCLLEALKKRNYVKVGLCSNCTNICFSTLKPVVLVFPKLILTTTTPSKRAIKR